METYTQNYTIEFHNCSPISEIYPDFVDQLTYRIPFGLLYLVLFLMGVSGNVLVIYCISWRKVSVGVNSIQIVSLAYSDLLLCFTSLPFSGYHNFNRVWPLGSIGCKAMPTLQAASTFICVFTLAAIAIDRYRAMQLNLVAARHQPQSRCDAQYVVVLFIWLLGFAAAIPYTIVMHLLSYDSICGMFCEEMWQSSKHAKAYGSIVFIAEFVCPLLILVYCYGAMRIMVRNSYIRTHQNLLKSKQQRGRDSKEKKTSRIIVLMCLAFAFSWLPINALNMSRDFHLIGEDYLGIVFASSHLAAMSSVIWNPLIYCWMNSNFHNQFLSLVWCGIKKKKLSTRRDENCNNTKKNNSNVFSSNSHIDSQFEIDDLEKLQKATKV